MAQMGRRKNVMGKGHQKEWSQKNKSLFSKVKTGLKTGYANLKHGVQRKVSKVVTKEEQKSIGRGLKTVGSGAKKVIKSTPVKKVGGLLANFADRQQRMWGMKK